MSLEVRPLGVRCNIACQYCYQNPERDAGNELRDYDLPRMLERIGKETRPFTLFGGEPLMLPLRDLERLWAFAFERFGGSGMQTNGTLIRPEHLELFQRYRVDVGISVDGPAELNDVRWAGTLEKTRLATARTLRAIQWLCDAGRPPSLIVTLHRCNATGERLPALLRWIRELHASGVRALRLHLLEVEQAEIREKYSLTPAENLAALLAMRDLEGELPDLHLDMFRDMRRMLLGQDKNVTCVWAGCDPYTTDAVQGLDGNGQSTNCGRTNKDGIDFVKAGAPGFERYLGLYWTPQEHGGCRGCRFFLMCKGQCPGTALEGDWRNRTEHCEVIKTLYERIEAELVAEGLEPLSLTPARAAIEAEFVRAWSAGQTTSVAHLTRAREPAETVRAGAS